MSWAHMLGRKLFLPFIVVVFAMVGYIMIAYYYRESYRTKIVQKEPVEKTTGSGRKRQEIEAAILKTNRKVVSEECSPNTNYCYLITDYAVREEGELVVKRSMVLKNIPQYTHTIVELSTPETLTWQNFNSRDWAVNKAVVVSRYIKVQIAAGFFTEAMSLEETANKQEVLLIGLGGGVGSNFLSELDWLGVHTTVVELDPFIAEVANEWFGHTDQERTTLILDDGIEYVKKAKSEGNKFRSIILDACYNELERPILCPVDGFLKNETIQNMADILEDGGVLTVNLVVSRDVVAHEDEILADFKPFFPSCYLLKLLPERRMLICSKRENWTWEAQRERFLKNIAAVDDSFAFQISQFFKEL